MRTKRTGSKWSGVAGAMAVALLGACAGEPQRDLGVSLPGGASTVSQEANEGGPDPAPVTLQIANNGNCPLAVSTAVQTANGGPWFAAAAPGAPIAVAGTGQVTLTFSVIAQQLGAGLYTGTLVLTGTCTTNGRPATGSPRAISVNLRVRRLGATLDPASETVTEDIDAVQFAWTPMSAAGAPAARSDHTMVATPEGTVVFGGLGAAGAPLNTGGRYDASADRWFPVTNAPDGRFLHTAVYSHTHRRMFVFGGAIAGGAAQATGYAYDPAADTWSPLATDPAPAPRSRHVAVMAGDAMLVWGGMDAANATTNTGRRYAHSTGTWTAMSTVGAPSPRVAPSVVWTGTEMIVFGGYSETTFMGIPTTVVHGDGAAYSLTTNTWRSISNVDAPSGRERAAAVWTGREMFVFGGQNPAGTAGDTGGLYDPIRDRWSAIAPLGSEGRFDGGHSMVWTGRRAIVFGGSAGAGPRNATASFDPVVRDWQLDGTPMGAPSARSGHAAAWTGGEMVVFGGVDTLGASVGVGGVFR